MGSWSLTTNEVQWLVSLVTFGIGIKIKIGIMKVSSQTIILMILMRIKSADLLRAAEGDSESKAMLRVSYSCL